MNITNITDSFFNGTSPVLDQMSDSNPYFSTTAAVAAGSLLLGIGGAYLAKRLSGRCQRVVNASNAVVSKTISIAKQLVGRSPEQLARKAQIKETVQRIEGMKENYSSRTRTVSLDRNLIKTLTKPDPFYEIEADRSNSLLGSAIQVLGQLNLVKNLPKAIEKKLCEKDLFPGGVTQVYEENKKKLGNDPERLNALANIGMLLRKSEMSSEELDNLLTSLKILNPATLDIGAQAQGKINQLMLLLELKQCLSLKRISTGKMNDLFAALRKLDEAAFKQISSADPKRALDILTQLLSPVGKPEVEIFPPLKKKTEADSEETGETPYRIYPMYEKDGAEKNVRTADLDKKLIEQIEGNKHEPYKIMGYVTFNVEDPKDAAVILDPGRFSRWQKWDLMNKEVVSAMKIGEMADANFRGHQDAALIIGKKFEPKESFFD